MILLPEQLRFFPFFGVEIGENGYFLCLLRKLIDYFFHELFCILFALSYFDDIQTDLIFSNLISVIREEVVLLVINELTCVYDLHWCIWRLLGGCVALSDHLFEYNR